MKNNQQRSVAVYDDYQNVPLSQNILPSLRNFILQKGQLTVAKIYHDSLNESKIQSLSKLYPWIKPISVECDHKNALDYRLSFDLIQDIHSQKSPEIIILISKDGDFIGHAKTVKYFGIELIIIGHENKISQGLIQLADACYYIKKERLIKMKKR